MKVLVLLNTSKIQSSFAVFLNLVGRYGEDASVLTENAAYAIGNTALTAYHVNSLGPKSVRIFSKARNHYIIRF